MSFKVIRRFTNGNKAKSLVGRVPAVGQNILVPGTSVQITRKRRTLSNGEVSRDVCLVGFANQVNGLFVKGRK